MQLDIFADSRDVMLRNDVLDALHRRHPGEAREAWERLAGEFPDDGSLSGLATLIRVLEEGVATPFTEHATLAAACARLNDEVEPAARRLLGNAAGGMGGAVVAGCCPAGRRGVVPYGRR